MSAPDEEEPEVREPVTSECVYCGATFEGVGDDCGACRLTGEDLDRYAAAVHPRSEEPPRRARSAGGRVVQWVLVLAACALLARACRALVGVQ